MLERKRIIRTFLERGILLSPEELAKINENNYTEFLEKHEKKGRPEPGKEKSKTTVTSGKPAEKITVDDFIKNHTENYEFLKGILLKKTDAVSINKGRKIFHEVSIIGRAKEVAEREFILEDVTGETRVVPDRKEPVSEGDVIALVGFFKENSFFPKSILWPDIPLDKTPEKIEGIKIVLSSKPIEDKDRLVINHDDGLPNPRQVSLERNGKNMTILLFRPAEKINDQNATKILKSRAIGKDATPGNIIRQVPAVFWVVDNDENWTRNYRGVVIISTDRESFAEYDTSSNEVVFGKI
jgi:hypothetical protein